MNWSGLRRAGRVLALGTLLASVACSVQIARDLDDGSANQMIVALEREGVIGSKEPDTDNEGKWVISVSKSDATHAATLLSSEGLPTPRPAGLAQIAEQKSLIPSQQTEQARLLVGIASDLERTLLTVDGIVAARVHLAVPAWDPLDRTSSSAVPGASVLIRHRGRDCPIAVSNVQRLVAGAATTSPEQVVVVVSPVAERRSTSRPLTRVGPFVVARDSERLLRSAIGVFVALNLTTLALLLYFRRKARRDSVG
jgi:type III secretion protein J